MAKKKSVRRENGRGTIEVTKSKSRPYKAKFPTGTRTDKNGKVQAVYKTIGTFATRGEAEDALVEYARSPYDLDSTVNTFSELYHVWSEYYFKCLNHESSIRTVVCAYAYCSGLYNMPIKKIDPGHIKDVMNTGFIIVKDGQHKGERRFASIGTKERIKSMCNLMFDYAVEHRLLIHNPAREFKIGNILQEIEKNAKKKESFTPKQVAELWKYYTEIPFADMVLIAIYTGFRPQEVALLEVKKVFLDENKLVGGMKTLNGIDREVPIHPDIRPLIEKRYAQAANRFHSDMLFNDAKGRQGTKMTYDKYRGKFDNVMKDKKSADAV